jgi:hypothetical protein
MEWDAALLIFALAAAAGALLYLPFFVWFRWRGSKRTKGGATTRRLTRAGLWLYGIEIVVLFAGFAVGTLYPQSWLGAQLRTLFGGLGYAAAVVIAVGLVERALVRRGVRPWVGPSPDPPAGALVSSRPGRREGDA